MLVTNISTVTIKVVLPNMGESETTNSGSVITPTLPLLIILLDKRSLLNLGVESDTTNCGSVIIPILPQYYFCSKVARLIVHTTKHCSVVIAKVH